MSVERKAIYQVPDWIDSDGRKAVKITKPTGQKPNVNVTRLRPNVRPNSNHSAHVRIGSKSNVTRPIHRELVGLLPNSSDVVCAEPESETRRARPSERRRGSGVGIRKQNAKSETISTLQKKSSACGARRHHIDDKQVLGSRPGLHSKHKGSKKNNAQNALMTVGGDSDSGAEMYKEVASDGILFIDSNSTFHHDDHPGSMGKISPDHLMHASGASSFDCVFEVILHSHALEIIENLSKFTKLKTLDLSCNTISKIENLEQNKELKELKLYGNNISQIKGLESLDGLCHLQLQHNKITAIGNGLKNRKSLKILRLDSNRLEVIATTEVASLSALVSLDISCNKLQDISFINALTVLEEFNASHNRLETVADIGRCKRLKEINISSNQLRDISGLCGVQSLLVLSIADNLLTNTSLKALGKLQCLQYLDCSGNKLTNLAMFHDQFPSLEVLLAARNKLENVKKLLCLQRCLYLTEVILEDNPVCSDNASYQQFKQDLASSLENLEMMDRVNIKKPKYALSSHVPIMRPMSAASALSTRQVENQLKYVDDTLSMFEMNLTSSFANLRASMSFLPSEEIKNPKDQSSSTASSCHHGGSTPNTPRPTSRCGSHQRIVEARAYAAGHF